MTIQLISAQDQLNSAISRLESSNEIAIDLEFDKNYYRYGFNLCLMQIFDGKNCCLIDPLSNKLDIESVFPVLENDDIQKVAFAFGEDLRLLHSMGCFPKNMYDLDNAISLLNYPPASLTNHLDSILGVDTGKSSQMSNWYKRPLSDDQKKYAAQDVVHLLKLKKVLEKEADEKNISGWIEEENRLMGQLDYSEIDNNDFLKEKDKHDFTEREWLIYSRVMETREELAEKLNKPSFQIIQKEVIKKIAQDPDRLEDWTSTRGIYKRLRTSKMKEKLNDVVELAFKEADESGLTDDEPAIKSLSNAEKSLQRNQRERINLAKNEFFNPIKQKIEEDYGSEVSTFLFSNRIIAELVTASQPKIASYKYELLKKYADDLGLQPEDYLNIEP
jgi:ribonuclease D